MLLTLLQPNSILNVDDSSSSQILSLAPRVQEPYKTGTINLLEELDHHKKAEQDSYSHGGQLTNSYNLKA